MEKKPPALISINTLAGVFESTSELQTYCDSQFLTIQKAQTRIKQLEEQVAHLQGLISSTNKILDANTNTDQLICEIQIERIKKTAMDRDLTLEETKRLDLLVKNLYLSKEKNSAIPVDFEKFDISEAQLIEIAAKPEKQVESD